MCERPGFVPRFKFSPIAAHKVGPRQIGIIDMQTDRDFMIRVQVVQVGSGKGAAFVIVPHTSIKVFQLFNEKRRVEEEARSALSRQLLLEAIQRLGISSQLDSLRGVGAKIDANQLANPGRADET